MEEDIMAKAYDAGEYCLMVRYEDGFYQIDRAAEEEDWREVLALADEVESLGPLAGWGEYTSAWKVTIKGYDHYYFVR